MNIATNVIPWASLDQIGPELVASEYKWEFTNDGKWAVFVPFITNIID